MWRFHQFPEIQNSIFIPGWTWIHDPSAPASSANPTGAYHHNRLNYAFLKSMFFFFPLKEGVGWGGVPECLFPLYCFRPVIDFKPEPGVLSKDNKHDPELPSGSSSLITSCWEAYRSHCGVLSFAYHRTLLGSVRMRHTYVCGDATHRSRPLKILFALQVNFWELCQQRGRTEPVGAVF